MFVIGNSNNFNNYFLNIYDIFADGIDVPCNYLLGIAKERKIEHNQLRTKLKLLIKTTCNQQVPIIGIHVSSTSYIDFFLSKCYRCQ